MYKIRTKLLKIESYLFLAMVALLIFPPVSVAEIKVVNLRHVTSDRTLPLVRQMLGQGGTVGEWEGRLIINASPEVIGTIEEMLRQIDVPPVMLRITVRTEQRDMHAGQRSGPGSPNRNTAMKSVSLDNGSRPSPGWHLSNSANDTEFFLRVRDGGQAFIMVEKSVPYVREMLALAGRYGGYGQSLDFQVINSGFWIRPVLEGDFAYLDVQPHLEGFQKNSSGVTGLPTPVELQSLGTSLRAPLGKWVDLGGVLRQSDEISRAIVTWKAGKSQEETIIWIKVDLQDENR